MTAKLASERPYRWLYARLIDKWHLDELYDAIVIRPCLRISEVLLYEAVDRRVIDGVVNLTGWVGRHVGWLAQLFHTGNVQRYLAVFAIGLLILFNAWFAAFRHWQQPAGAAMEAPTPVFRIIEPGSNER